MSGPIIRRQIDNSKIFPERKFIKPFKDGWMLCSVCRTKLVPIPAFLKNINHTGEGKIIIPCAECSRENAWKEKIKNKTITSIPKGEEK